MDSLTTQKVKTPGAFNKGKVQNSPNVVKISRNFVDSCSVISNQGVYVFCGVWSVEWSHRAALDHWNSRAAAAELIVLRYSIKNVSLSRIQKSPGQFLTNGKSN